MNGKKSRKKWELPATIESPGARRGVAPCCLELYPPIFGLKYTVEGDLPNPNSRLITVFFSL